MATDKAGSVTGLERTSDLDSFLRDNPWPDAVARPGQPMHWLWTFELDASPEALWPHVSDTSRLNRSMGLDRMQIAEVDGVVHGVSTHGGKVHTWTEPPWEWEAARRLAVIRQYSRGWAHCVRSMYELVPLDGGRTRMRVYFGWVPRGLLGRVVLKLGMGALEARYRAALERIARQAREDDAAPFKPPVPDLDSMVHARIDAAAERLVENGVSGQVVDAITQLIRSGDDLDLDKIQPKRLAREWQQGEREVIRGFLHATRIGLFELSWEVVCPLCRGVRESAGTLSSLPGSGSCEVCNVEFSTGEEHAVEVSFRIHPSIRVVPRVVYCTAEPARRLHIRAQVRVSAGSKTTAQPRLSPGRYRMRLLEDGDTWRYLEVVEDGDREPELSCGLGGDARCGADPTLTLVNDGDDDVHFIVEGLSWNDDALLPQDLFSVQDFHDLFSDEYISDDIQLSVGVQTLLFTDVIGSTRFYASEGDPAAFVRVREHFKIIHDIVAEHRGAVVKTIGDAVMAAFPDAVDSLRASLAIHRAFDGSSSPLRVRVSLNAGPCIAVNLNSAIDYFGGTVNLAAKLQACAETAQVAMSEAVYDAPGVRDYLAEQNAEVVELSFEIAALGETIPVYRWDT